jgi:hypothetical protein
LQKVHHNTSLFFHLDAPFLLQPIDSTMPLHYYC